MTDDLSEIKRVLRSVWWTQKRLDADLELLAWLRAKAEGVRGMEYERQTVHGGAEHSALEDAACAIADYEAKIEAEVAQWREALDRVTGVIHDVPSQKLAVILQMRYLNLWAFEKIAVELGYTWRHVNRMHVKALKEANTVYQAQKEKDVIECHSLDVI
ncbi:hypothetical protein [Pyramidobacter piscolens]|uniref:hypothetical protein n=1 Tax=Pyramidobacter piscolens TaxID=638849 RepID=UPI002665680B|nr:hypothetical protein [Pyramidobacter piscolens]